ncbi:putative Na+/H+ antiporter [Fluviispira sanaruensis]|uniref:Membrane protein n=1 Tax=Fluviispira sanaruensis TaxID=2493639 RepID=A0A4P2VN97_FLUSA|nr:putative Na+/H+ antiporter [Fluviispira sanaruensis]BBH54328.1 membrane protein [Fluviispira sanaruensis]
MTIDCVDKTSIIPTLLENNVVLFSVTTIFVLAVIHTFCASRIVALAHKRPKGSMSEKVLDFLGEVEVVFGFWAFVFLALLSAYLGMQSSLDYLNGIDFKEPIFVFIIMCMSATKPVMFMADRGINFISKFFSKIFFVPYKLALFSAIFIFGTLSGSLLTEPVAMTVSALLLHEHFFQKTNNAKFKYAMLGLLFVNVSIGGTLTHFAAPPVLIVAAHWDWDAAFMFMNFGWKSAIAIVTGTLLTAVYFRKDIIRTNKFPNTSERKQRTPYWIVGVNVGFLVLSIVYHKYVSFLVPLFLLFIGWFEVTKEYQDSLKIRESLLVGFFLGGIVTLGALQQWWLIPLMNYLNPTSLFFGATALTAVTDNAALTYLGTLVPNLSDEFKYSLVAGAVAGGGLTVIANAPNPIGYGILNKSCGEDGISPLYLFLGSLPYTALAIVCLTIL